jgi:hypothetical protein
VLHFLDIFQQPRCAGRREGGRSSLGSCKTACPALPLPSSLPCPYPLPGTFIASFPLVPYTEVKHGFTVEEVGWLTLISAVREGGLEGYRGR